MWDLKLNKKDPNVQKISKNAMIITEGSLKSSQWFGQEGF